MNSLVFIDIIYINTHDNLRSLPFTFLVVVPLSVFTGNGLCHAMLFAPDSAYIDIYDNWYNDYIKFTDVESDEDGEDEVDTGQTKMTISKTIGNSKVKCTLNIRTQLLIKLIFNDDMFVNQMSSMNLSKLSMITNN